MDVKPRLRVRSGDQPAYQDLVPVVDVDSLPAATDTGTGQQFPRNQFAPSQYTYYNGEKFPGGFGPTQLYVPDYWTLRQRSGQLFRDNLYARGLIDRLITNEINTGLSLDCTPAVELIDAMSEDALSEWAEQLEARWRVFAAEPRVCDFQRTHNEGQLQRIIRREALIDGDILVVQQFDEDTEQLSTQLIRGEFVQTPPGADVGTMANGNRIEEGVEIDANGRHIAYHILQPDQTTRRQLAVGARSGQRQAWLVYGTKLRFGDVRGEPLLSVILQSLKEIDRYRDSAQRKAVINSLIAMYVTKGEDRMGTRPFGGGAVRKQGVAAPTDDNPARTLNFNGMIPGVVIDELGFGEDIKGFRPDGTDVNYGNFEAAMVQAIAWANQMPPEILTLSFSSNYSASQAAINEFKLYLTLIREDFAAQYCVPRYHRWLYNELLAGRVEAPGLLAAWNDLAQYQLVGAWRASDWTGAIKPSTDIVKQTRGVRDQLSEALITHERATKELTGTNFRQNVRRLKKENELLAEAMAPLQQAAAPAGANSGNNSNNNALRDLIADALTDLQDEVTSG